MKKLFFIALSLIIVTVQGFSQNIINSYTANAYEAEAVSLFSGGVFTLAEKAIINDCIRKLKDDSQWTHIYELKVYGVSTETNALLDWKNASYNATKVGSPTFTAYQGWTGTGSTSDYIRSGFNPNGIVSLNNVLSIAWELSDETSNGALFGAQSGANQGLLLIPRSATNTAISRLNSNGNDAVSQTGRPTGYWRMERNASANYTVHILQTLKSTYSKVSSSVPNLEIYDLAINNAGVVASAGQRQIGARITASGDADSQKISDAINDCLVRLFALASANKTPRGYAYGERSTWESLRFGGFICWTNNIPNGTEVYSDNRANPVFSVTSFTPNSIDIDDWITTAQNAQMEYLILTVKHNMGWSLYPFSTDIQSHTGKDSYHSTISLPQVSNYGVGNAAISGTTQQDIVSQFVTKCTAAGIKPILYYNIGKDINARGGFDGVANSAFSSDAAISATYGYYTTMVEERIRELLQAFPSVWLWLDAIAWYPRTAHQSLFNVIRTYGNENTLVIYNYDNVQGSSDVADVMKPNGTNSANYPGTLDGRQFYIWPFDVASFEHQRTTGALYSYIKTHNKYAYWAGSEITSPVFTSDQWFYRDQAVVGGTPNVLESLANLSPRADVATTNLAPFAVAICPNASGVISSQQKTRLAELGAHIFP